MNKLFSVMFLGLACGVFAVAVSVRGDGVTVQPGIGADFQLSVTEGLESGMREEQRYEPADNALGDYAGGAAAHVQVSSAA